MEPLLRKKKKCCPIKNGKLKDWINAMRDLDTVSNQAEAHADALATHLKINEALGPKNSCWICKGQGYFAK